MSIQLTRRNLVWLVVGVLTTLALGLALVCLNIERVDVAYELKKLQVRYDEKQSHAAKLRVERDNLLSPGRLRREAEEYGLVPAQSGQIRRLEQRGG
jgi:cell division protein FtsL